MTHFNISAISNQPRPQTKLSQYTLQLAERLPCIHRSRDDHNIESLMKRRMQAIQNSPQTAFASVADDRFPHPPARNNPITIV